MARPDASFDVRATGNDLRYQWQKGDQKLANSRKFEGTTDCHLVVRNVQKRDEGVYSCSVWCGNRAQMKEVSHIAQLTLVSPPFIKTHPRDEKGILPGNDVTFIVELAEKESGVHFEWRKWNDTLPSGCSGAHSEMLTIHQVSPDDTGYYYCCVSNAHGRATSQRAKLSILKAPVITEHPRDKDTADLVGDEVSFTVKAQGRGLRFKWKKDGRPLPQALVRGARDEGDLAAVERASTLSIDIKDAQAFYAGIYQCVVSNAAGKVKSRAARLSLDFPMIIRHPNSLIIPVQKLAVAGFQAEGREGTQQAIAS